MVTLRSLGKVSSDDGHALASYNALLASGDWVEVAVSGRRIGVRLTREGIALDAWDVTAGAPAQFTLPLGDDPLSNSRNA